MTNPALSSTSPASVVPGISSVTLPSAWAAQAESQLSDGERVLAWMEIDLDAHLHFASGLVVVTNRRILASTENDVIWREWAFRAGLMLVRYDHSGVGSLELVDADSLLARWRYTLGSDIAARRLIEHFTQQLGYQLTGVPLPPPSEALCPKCQRVLDAPLLPGQEECASCSSEVHTPPSTWTLFRVEVCQALQMAAACRISADIGQHGGDASTALLDDAANGQRTDSLSERQADR